MAKTLSRSAMTSEEQGRIDTISQHLKWGEIFSAVTKAEKLEEARGRPVTELKPQFLSLITSPDYIKPTTAPWAERGYGAFGVTEEDRKADPETFEKIDQQIADCMRGYDNVANMMPPRHVPLRKPTNKTTPAGKSKGYARFDDLDPFRKYGTPRE